MSQKYVVAHFFDEYEPGFNFSSKEWPLHITLLPNFTLESSPEEFVQTLGKVAAQIVPFIVRAEGRDLFGENHNIPVMLIRPDDEIMGLHNRLLVMARNASATYDDAHSRYIGELYRPHVTVHGHDEFPEGQVRKLGSVSLVDMYPGEDISRREVIGTFPLGSGKGLS